MQKSVLSYFVLFVIFILTNQADAQFKKPGLLIGGNVMYNTPKGTLANDYKAGLGAEVLGGIGVGKTYLIATLGYARFLSKADASDIIYKPMKIGLRQYFLAKRIFLNADIGKANLKDKTANITESRFTRGFGGGIRLAGLEAGLYYDGWKNKNTNTFSNSLQFKLGWNLTI